MRGATVRRVLAVLGAAAFGIVMLVAAATKAIDPVAFAEQIEAEGLAVVVGAYGVALIALALEVAIGTALLVQIRRRWTLAPAAALTVFFLFLTGRAYWRWTQGIVDEASCGCFGNLLDRTPAEAFWQDVVILVVPLALAALAPSRTAVPRARIAVVVLATVGIVAFALRAPELPLDDVATRVKPGTALDELCAGSEETRICLTDIAPELADGEGWVVLADLTAMEADQVDRLNALTMAGHRVTVLTEASLEEVNAFTWTWGPMFGVREAPPSLVRSMYRRRPRSFTIEDGVVVETTSDMPPAEAGEGE